MPARDPHPIERHLPAITRAQVVANVQAFLTAAALIGLHLSDAKIVALAGLSGFAYVVLVWADKSIRQHRAENLGELLGDAEFAAALRAVPNEVAKLRDKPAPVRQLETVKSEAELAAEAEAANGPPPEPGTYAPDEPTGS
jgi:hypothetical protein